LPEINANAKVIAVDVNENAIAYGNDDFVEKFETKRDYKDPLLPQASADSIEDS
jgi:hypothetical protein